MPSKYWNKILWLSSTCSVHFWGSHILEKIQWICHDIYQLRFILISCISEVRVCLVIAWILMNEAKIFYSLRVKAEGSSLQFICKWRLLKHNVEVWGRMWTVLEWHKNLVYELILAVLTLWTELRILFWILPRTDCNKKESHLLSSA